MTATTLRSARIPFLLGVHGDLAACHADWEWIIAVDGTPAATLPAAISDDPRVRVLHVGRPAGAAACRNLALGVARGRYTTSVDDDDQLPPGSVEARLAAADADGLGWVGGRLADLRDGILCPWRSPMPTGHAAAGAVWRAWGCPCAPFPIGPTTLLVDTDLLRCVGGWHGLPQAEDLGMVLAVTGRARGRVLDRVVYAYRRHPGQMTIQPGFDDLEPLVRHVVFERGRLIAQQESPDARRPMSVA